MRILFVMDPLDRMHPLKDSTFAFMRGAMKRGHQCLHCLPHHLSVREGRVFAHVSECSVSDTAPHWTYGAKSQVPLDELGAVMIRKDPPFDHAYSLATLMLEHARGKVLIVNDPQGLREANEKLYAIHFSKWMARTIVSSNRDEILAYVSDVGGRAVIKPLDGAGGVGVMTLTANDKNAKAIIDVVTGEGTRLAMVQAFLDKVVEGDKRVIVLDGDVLGAILRVPMGDDFRANIHVGGQVKPTELSAREKDLVADLAPRLRKDGLFFVGLDLIGEHLTEVNVTSPTGIQELGRFSKSFPEDKVIAWIEQHAITKGLRAGGALTPGAGGAEKLAQGSAGGPYRAHGRTLSALPCVSSSGVLVAWGWAVRPRPRAAGGAGRSAAGRSAGVCEARRAAEERGPAGERPEGMSHVTHVSSTGLQPGALGAGRLFESAPLVDEHVGEQGAGAVEAEGEDVERGAVAEGAGGAEGVAREALAVVLQTFETGAGN